MSEFPKTGKRRLHRQVVFWKLRKQLLDNILFSTFYTGLFFRGKNWGGTGPSGPSPCYGTVVLKEICVLFRDHCGEFWSFWERHFWLQGFVDGTLFLRSVTKCPNALFIVEVHLPIKLVHRHSTFDNLQETIEIIGWESQLAGGRPVGYIQAQPRSWGKEYKSSWWSERELNSGFPDFKSSTQTTRPRFWRLNAVSRSICWARCLPVVTAESG